jgi:hypothetical protein
MHKLPARTNAQYITKKLLQVPKQNPEELVGRMEEVSKAAGPETLISK